MTGKPEALPAGRLVAFYGDDFTGSAAVMEVLAFAGIETVLFLAPPTSEQLARFGQARAIGIAGTARSETPVWMDRELPAIFHALAALDAPIVQYKICSTLDSSPELGSIGKAAEIGLSVIGGAWAPILGAAPSMGRFQAFGHFFATAAGTTWRLDRHPTMSRHPATPIHESDIRLHIGQQTDQPIGLVDVVALKSGDGERVLRDEMAKARLIAFDAIDDETLRTAGKLIWEGRGDCLFAVASQGLEYALIAWWREAGLLAPASPPPHASPVDCIVAVSGSCSDVTGRQIGWASGHGFSPVAVDAAKAVDACAWQAEVSRAEHEGLCGLSDGKSPILFTAAGPDDPSLGRFRSAVESSGADPAAVNARIGQGLGAAVERLVRQAGISRAAIAGGDTSSHAVLALDIHALTALAHICPGGSLLRIHASRPPLDGLEVALKGGQMGPEDYFGRVRAGGGV